MGGHQFVAGDTSFVKSAIARICRPQVLKSLRKNTLRESQCPGAPSFAHFAKGGINTVTVPFGVFAPAPSDAG